MSGENERLANMRCVSCGCYKNVVVLPNVSNGLSLLGHNVSFTCTLCESSNYFSVDLYALENIGFGEANNSRVYDVRYSARG